MVGIRNGKRSRCNWEYTGEYECGKNCQVKAAMYKTDCNREAKWTRDNQIGLLFKDYGNQKIPQGADFLVECPYCRKILNIYNPYDDGETWRE